MCVWGGGHGGDKGVGREEGLVKRGLFGIFPVLGVVRGVSTRCRESVVAVGAVCGIFSLKCQG